MIRAKNVGGCKHWVTERSIYLSVSRWENVRRATDKFCGTYI